MLAVSAVVAGIIGQGNDGPWSALPEWLGAVGWLTFGASVLAILVLSASLATPTCDTARSGPDRMRVVSLRGHDPSEDVRLSPTASRCDEAMPTGADLAAPAAKGAAMRAPA